jgi:hypothetical protein
MNVVLKSWLINLFTLGSISFIVFLLRDSIRQWVTVSIRHSYDRKLEEFRAENERALKQFGSALETQQDLVSTAFLEARRASNERRLNTIQTV